MPAKVEDSPFAHSLKSHDARDDDFAGGLDIFPDADNDEVEVDLSANYHVNDSHSSFDFGYDGYDSDPLDGYDGYDSGPYDAYDGYDSGPYDAYDGYDFDSYGDYDGYE